MRSYPWYGMHLPKLKSLINGWLRNPGHRKQNLWILKWADEDFMQWLVRMENRNAGQFRNTPPLLRKQTSKCSMCSQTKMKTPNPQDLIGITPSAKKTEPPK